ncbi:hypothetical protein AMECASPLE_027638 [Ameca splendens]|uniref:Secreted protein n=1 Tax=Ameca splendens TaxID=208324 RepID=A0ABV0YHD2_9TELE
MVTATHRVTQILMLFYYLLAPDRITSMMTIEFVGKTVFTSLFKVLNLFLHCIELSYLGLYRSTAQTPFSPEKTVFSGFQQEKRKCIYNSFSSSRKVVSNIFRSVFKGIFHHSSRVYGREAGYTLNRSPVHCRATQRRKPEYQERIHACTGRTFKLHAERTQDLLAERQQCYQLHHHAA